MIFDNATAQSRKQITRDKPLPPMRVMGARSVAASYKPPMLVPWLRLPACALTRPAWGGHRSWKSTASCGIPATWGMMHQKQISMSVHHNLLQVQEPTMVGGHSPEFVPLLQHIGTHDSCIATRAGSVAASYKPPMLVTQVRLPVRALTRFAWGGHRARKSSASFGYLPLGA